MTQPPGTQPPGAQSWGGPTGQLVLNLKSTWGSRAMIRPQLWINGQPAPATWGRNELTVVPGQLQVEVSCIYMWEYGRAVDTVPVAPNSRVEVFYSAPYFTFLSGRIGPVTQPRRGGVALVIVLILLGIAVVLAVIGAILGS